MLTVLVISSDLILNRECPIFDDTLYVINKREDIRPFLPFFKKQKCTLKRTKIKIIHF